MEILSLNGLWAFRTDPDGTGAQQGWYAGDVPFAEELKVPGGWLLEGNHGDYHGKAWYKRSFTLSAQQAQKRAVLRFGGVYRYADVYVNGSLALRHEGYQSAFEADVTAFVHEGENTVAVCADDVCRENDLMLPGPTIFGMPQMRFAGIYEPVTLQLRRPVCAEAMYAALTPELDAVETQLMLVNSTGTACPCTVEVTIAEADGQVVRQTVLETCAATGSRTLCCRFDAKGLSLWSPESPALYTVTACVKTEAGQDVLTQRTGFKHFTVRGKDFYLNGHPYFLRGYGDDFVWPMTAQPSATDKSFYYHGLQRAKAYGFNAVRCHSHFPFEPYFEAADELGLLIQPELAFANIPVGWLTEEAAQLFLAEWEALVTEHRSHPSVMAWCGGNEMEWGYFFEDRIIEAAHRLDPYRPAVPTDGRWMAREVADDPNYPFVSVCHVEYTDVLPLDEYADLYDRDDFGKPTLVHEMCNYCTLPPIHDLARYEGAVNAPALWKSWAEKLQAAGRLPMYERAAENALALQKLCYKLALEKARLAAPVRGYHVWTIVDFYDTTQGLLDQFFGDKAFTAQEFSALNASSVLLWDTDRYCFAAGENITCRIRLSRFEPQDWPGAQLTLTLRGCRGVYAQQTLTADAVGHGLLPLTDWVLKLPAVDTGEKYTLSARLEHGEAVLENSWELWVYPAPEVLRRPSQREVFIHYLARHLVESQHRMVRHFTIPMDLGENLLVTGYLMGGMLEAVHAGARMLLLAQPDTFVHIVTGNAFKSCWWMQEEFFYINRSNNTQTANVLEDHPALAAVPHGACWGLNWFHLVEQRHAVDLEKLGFAVTPIVYGLGKDLERRGYLFEFRYGKGAVLVSTLHFEKKNLCHPEVQYVFDRLLDYMDSPAFAPVCSVTPEQLEQALKK